MAKKVIVGGRIESKEVGGIVTGAAEILDDSKGKKQSVINQETDAELQHLDQTKQNNLTFDNVPTEGSDNPVKSAGVYAADKALSDAIEAILMLIPSAASALNKLVDTAMMNSSISTATATFKGTYNVVTDLELAIDATHEQIAAKLGEEIATADNNDYAFVQIPVSAESTDIRRTERYKFNGTAWGYEYDLNTSGFTAAQWAAINSGITLALVGKLIGLPTSSELQALLGQKQDTLTFDNIPTSGSANPVKSGGVYSAINDEKTAREQLAQSVAGINGRLGGVEEVIPSGAAANNKLVANSSMEAYVVSIIEAITASFTIATADGHINLSLTQTNGRVASLTLISSDIASAQALTALTGRVSTAEGNITSIGGRMTTAEGNITSLGGRVSTNETDIANLQQLYNDLQQSKPVPVTALPSSGQQQGVVYRLAGTTSYSDYMWNGSTWVLMATYNNAIDDVPIPGSNNLVKSGGVTNYASKSFLSSNGIFNSLFKEFFIQNPNIDISQITSMYIDKAMYRSSDYVYRSQIVFKIGDTEVFQFKVDAKTEVEALNAFTKNVITICPKTETNNAIAYFIMNWDSLATGQRHSFNISITDAVGKEQSNPAIYSYINYINNNSNLLFSQIGWLDNSSWDGGTSFIDNNWTRITSQKIKIHNEKSIYLDTPNSNYKFELYVFDSNNNMIAAFDSWNAGNNKMVVPANADYYFIVAAKIDNSTITIPELLSGNSGASIILEQKLDQGYSIHSLTIGNQNVRRFQDEGTSGDDGGSVDVNTYLPLWKKQISDFLNQDFLTIIEWRDYFDQNDTIDTYNTLLKQFYPYHFVIRDNKGLFSKIPCVFERKVRNYEYIVGKTTINGKSLAVVSWVQGNLDNEEKVRADSQWMINQLVDFDLVVVAGDFNNEQGPQLLQVWLDNGYTLGNCGYWGEISTCIDSAFSHSSNDNIVTKGFIYDLFEKGNDRLGSDHYPVRAMLKYITD